MGYVAYVDACNDTISFSRPRDDDSGMYELVQRLEFRGAVEGLAFAKVRWKLYFDSLKQLYLNVKFTYYKVASLE